MKKDIDPEKSGWNPRKKLKNTCIRTKIKNRLTRYKKAGMRNEVSRIVDKEGRRQHIEKTSK